MDHIKSIVQDVLKKYSAANKSDIFEICNIWESVVGKTIAHDSRPWKLKGNALEVRVSNASWTQQLTFLKADIIQKLNDRIGEKCIEKIRFSVGHIPESS